MRLLTGIKRIINPKLNFYIAEFAELKGKRDNKMEKAA